MVFHKVSKEGDIFAICLNIGESLGEIGHAAGDGSKRIDELIPYRKVE